MGLLRLLLAFSVFLSHAKPFWNITLLNGGIAVNSFFIISGFYMTLILQSKYVGRGAKRLFFINRFLRIYPTYWVVLLLIVCLTFIKFLINTHGEENVIGNYIQFFSKMSTLAATVGVINYITRNVGFLFTIDYFYAYPHEPRLFLVQQAWTLQIELLFYLLSPFLVKRSLVFLFALTGLVVIFPHAIPEPYNQTLLYSFVVNLIYFIAGIISYRVYAFVQKKHYSRKVFFVAFMSILFLTITYNYLHAAIALPDWFYFFSVGTSLPFVFLFTKNSLFDKLLGNLSYPFYISHFIFIKLLSNTPLKNNNALFSTTALTMSLVIAIALYLLIDKPVDIYRQKLAKKLVTKV